MKTTLFQIAIALSTLIIFAVCFHSLEEIHYLKSFFPGKFTVEEAFYASGIELIKIMIITFPFFIVILFAICYLSFLRNKE